jgi:2-iminobutanoate/2-iminopropanoate deaminase
MSIERHPSNLGSFSESVVTSGPGRWIHVSGMVGFGDDGAVVDGGVAAETKATFDCIAGILERAGATLSDVVRMSVFMTDLADYGDFSRVRAEVFGDELPASAAVQVAGLLLGARIEIDAVAFVEES